MRLRFAARPDRGATSARSAAGGRCRSPSLALALAALVEHLAAASTASPAARTTHRRRARTGRRRSTSCTGRSSPDYRVEAVGTADHWEAVYLPQAAIPIVRGWFRQDDFPQNEVLYDKLTPRSYLAWLRDLSVRYVVLTDAAPDYSAKREIALLQSGRSGLPVVFRSADVTIYAVPSPHPIVTGPGDPQVEKVTGSHDHARAPAARPLPARHPLHAVSRRAGGVRHRGQERDDRAHGTDRAAPSRSRSRSRDGRDRGAHREPDDVPGIALIRP